LKDFLFDPKRARDEVGTLSGGMQNRLMLARTLINPGNLMILDEPTNDLDMDTLDMLQEILASYQGTLIIVSHDRDFLDRTVSEVLAFEGNAQIDSYIGGYSDYLREKEATLRQQTKKNKVAAQIIAPVIEKPAIVPASTLSFTEQHELAKLPALITALEQEMHELQGILAADASLYTSDPLRFDKTMRLLARAQKKLEEAEARWLMLEEKASAT